MAVLVSQRSVFIFTFLMVLSVIFLGSFHYAKFIDLNFAVRGSGMGSSLKENDYIAMDFAENLSGGDIVVYNPPVSTFEGHKIPKPLIGRIVASEGDRVYIRNDEVLVNGSELVEPYAIIDTPGEFYTSTPVGVPFDHYYIIQDKRYRSYGSNIFGPVPKSHILSKVLNVYKKGNLGFKQWIEYTTGLILGLLFFIAPFVFFRREKAIKSVKLFMISLMIISFVGFLVLVGSAIFDEEKQLRLWMKPIETYHNIRGWIKFIFLGSDLAVFFTVVFAWVGGVLSLREVFLKK
ncbi:MAG: hypothetical protein NPIRA04_30470 [Nitrospirales bacterium]|nr:MAG: hypothetical protein NPIRA04_30470 [Nitrospirales bacterium]